MAVRLACLKAFRKSSLFAFGAESGRDRGRGRGRRQSSSCLEGFKLAPRLTGIAQSREAFRKIWLSSWADTLSIFALRILDSRRTLCLCRRRDGRPRQNNLGGGRAPVELKAVPHSWVCLKSSAGHGTRHYLALAIAWDGDVEAEDGSGVPATVIFALLAPPLVASRPLLPVPATTLVWLPASTLARVHQRSDSLAIFPRFFQDGELWRTFRTTCLGPLHEEGPSRARGGLSRLRARPSFASAPLLSSGPRLRLRALLAMARYW